MLDATVIVVTTMLIEMLSGGSNIKYMLSCVRQK